MSEQKPGTKAPPATPEVQIPAVLRVRSTVKRIPVEVEDNTGQVQNWTMVGLMGDERDAYLNARKDIVQYDPSTGAAKILDYNGCQSELLIRCLKDAKGDPVKRDAIDRLPAESLDDLFHWAEVISGLNRKARADAKKP